MSQLLGPLPYIMPALHRVPDCPVIEMVWASRPLVQKLLPDCCWNISAAGSTREVTVPLVLPPVPAVPWPIGRTIRMYDVPLELPGLGIATTVQYTPGCRPVGFAVPVKVSVFPLAVGVVMVNQLVVA